MAESYGGISFWAVCSRFAGERTQLSAACPMTSSGTLIASRSTKNTVCATQDFRARVSPTIIADIRITPSGADEAKRVRLEAWGRKGGCSRDGL